VILFGAAGGRAFASEQPLAYGLYDRRLRPGDAFCQRAAIDIPADAPRGPLAVRLALGEGPPVEAGLRLEVR
jgi:hypothetical protein